MYSTKFTGLCAELDTLKLKSNKRSGILEDVDNKIIVQICMYSVCN